MEQYRSPYRWVVLFVGIIAYSVAFIQRMSPTVMADYIMADFAVSGAFMGLLASAYFYPYAFMQIPSGILSDNYSARKLISISLFIAFAGAFIFSIAPNEYIAFVGRLCVGFGVSIILMPVYKVLANWFDAKVYVVIISSVTALAAGLGSAFAGAPLAMLVEAFGWREVSMGISLATLLFCVLAMVFIKDAPKGYEKSLEVKQKEETYKEKTQSTSQGEEKLSVFSSIKYVLSKGDFWVFSISFFVNGAIMFSFAGLWAGIYYMDMCGLSRSEMSSILSYGSALAVISPIAFASFSAKISSRKCVLFIINGLVLFITLWLYMRNGVWSKGEIYIWGILFPSVFIIAPAIFFAGIRAVFPHNISGTASGLMYSMPMIASAIYQPLIGFLLDRGKLTGNITAEMFTPVTELYLVSATIAFLVTFALKAK